MDLATRFDQFIDFLNLEIESREQKAKIARL